MKSGAMAMLSLGFSPSFLRRAAAAVPSRRRLLIAIFQRGAVDGLNMIVPYGDAEYSRLRPSIAIPRPSGGDGALDLDGFFGLHPRMAPLMRLWKSASMAVVHACGSPDHTRSHFDAQDYMETATPGVKSTRDGWLNRYLQSTGEPGPLRGVALARQMPRTLRGRAPALALPSVESFGLRGNMSQQAFESAYAQTSDPTLAAGAREAMQAMRILQQVASDNRSTPGVEYPRSPFGQALREIGRLARADVGLEIAFAESNGWDHHVNEGTVDGQLGNRLDDLARGVEALTVDLGDRLADTVIITMSEFGRAAAENGNRGTDHGHGNAMIVIGGPVKGGRVYGRWPGLREDQRFEGRDLAVTTDFRDVFNELVTAHLGADAASAARVFPGFRPGGRVGIIRS